MWYGIWCFDRNYDQGAWHNESTHDHEDGIMAYKNVRAARRKAARMYGYPEDQYRRAHADGWVEVRTLIPMTRRKKGVQA